MANQPSIPFPCKITQEVDLVGAIRGYGNRTYAQTNDPDSHPDSLAGDAKQLDDLRKAATISSSSPGSEWPSGSVEQIILYHAQLAFMLGKFPLDIGASFPWYPLFATPTPPGQQAEFSLSGGLPTTDPVEISDLQYERCSVLYSLAAVYAHNATREDRSQPEGAKRAVSALITAAGILTYIRDAVLPSVQLSAEDRNPPSPDLSKPSLDALIAVLLAQAQESYFQTAINNHSKNGVIARIAVQVSLFYAEALAKATEARGAGGVWPTFAFPTGWINHVTYKRWHFAAVAQYRKSCDDSAANRYGDELGRLHLAQKYVKHGLDTSKKGVPPSVVVDIKSLQATLLDLTKRAERDNSLIYLQAVTSEASLPAIQAVPMAKPFLPTDVEYPIPKLHTGKGGLGMRPLFERLMPYAVHLAISIYDDRKEAFIREEVAAKKDDLDHKSTSTLQELNLPGSIQALEVPLGLPPSLLRKAEDLRREGGTKRLRTMTQDALSVAATDRKVLDDVSELLDQEESEDVQLRLHFGKERWTRPTSEALNEQLRIKIQKFRDTLDAAGSSDKLVRKKLGEWEGPLQLLEGPQDALEASVPSTSRRQNSYDDITSPSSQTALVRELRRMLEDLDDLIAARRRTLEDAKRAAEDDDIRPLVMEEQHAFSSKSSEKIEAAHFEDLFQKQLGNYNFYRDTLAGNERRQTDLLHRIADTNERFVSARKSDPVLKEREEALQRLDVALSKHQEIRQNLTEALNFYREFANLLDQLRATVREWVHARRSEAQGLLNALNMESMSVQDHESDRTTPTLKSPNPPARQIQSQQQQQAPQPTPSKTKEPTRPAQPTPRTLRAQQPGQWTPGMEIKFG